MDVLKRLLRSALLIQLMLVGLGSCVSTPVVSPVMLFEPVERGRSQASFRDVSHKGMVAAGHSLAAEAGAAVLEKGGNAADAAVAASFVISVVRPHSTGLGGGGFMLHFDHHDSKTHVYDFRERAPKRASRNMYIDAQGQPKKVSYQQKEVPQPSMNGHLSIAVPGLVRGLVEFHRKNGVLKLSEVIAPAVRAATLGFPVYPTLAAALADRAEVLKLYESSTKIFFRNGAPLKEGELLVQTDLAATLTAIAERGDAGFYQGPVAEKILAEMKRGGGLITAEDLSSYRVRERDPVVGTYRGRKIVSMPPPSSGGIHLIQMLNMLEGDDLERLGHRSAAYNHLLVEVMRRAFADRAVYLGDPEFVKVPLATLTSKEYAKKLRQSIRGDHATVSSQLRNPVIELKESSSTTHISVVDRWGSAVATTQTVNYSFGSCVVAEGTGVVMNDEMDDFSANPGAANAFGLTQGEANAVAPGKTPLSSMTPTIVFNEGGGVEIVVGSPGGPRIINAVLQTVLNLIDFKMPLLTAVHAHRLHHQWLPDQVRFEKGGLSEAGQNDLKRLGHILTPITTVGEVSAIVRLADGAWEGVADSRAEGKAVGQR